MKNLTGRKASQAFLLAAFIMTTACGQQTDLSSFQEETMSEEEIIRRDGTGEVPQDLEKLTDPDLSASEQAQALANYGHLDPKRVVPTELLKKAVLYFDANKSKIANKKYLSVIDFSKRSTKARFYIVDMANGSVWAIHTSHGKGSDSNHDGYAESFGNVSGSGKSSLGVYKTAETYSGAHGYSLRLDGLSSTNSRARSRAVVIHPANYVREASVVQGRSLGCPAVSPSISKKLIDKIKGGSIIYAGLSGIR
jgi:hypothetical protein